MTERQPFKAKCQMHGGDITLMVRPEDVEEFYSTSSRHIQDIFDYLTPAEREMFQSGICGECWVKVFPPEEEGPDGEPVAAEDLPAWVKYLASQNPTRWEGVDWHRGDDTTFFAYRSGEYAGMLEVVEVQWTDLPVWIKGAVDRSDRDLARFRGLRWFRHDVEASSDQVFFAYTRRGEHVQTFGLE